MLIYQRVNSRPDFVGHGNRDLLRLTFFLRSDSGVVIVSGTMLFGHITTGVKWKISLFVGETQKMCLCITISGYISWYHHYGWLIPHLSPYNFTQIHKKWCKTSGKQTWQWEIHCRDLKLGKSSTWWNSMAKCLITGGARTHPLLSSAWE